MFDQFHEPLTQTWQAELSVGDIVAFRFPHEKDGEEAPKIRPTLVVDIENLAGQRFAVLAYGTSNPRDRRGGYTVDVRAKAELKKSSLLSPTRFHLARRIKVSVMNAAFHVAPDRDTPVLGSLSGAALERLHQVRARIQAEHDMRLSGYLGPRTRSRLWRHFVAEHRAAKRAQQEAMFDAG